MRRYIFLLLALILLVGCKYSGLQTREATPEDIALANATQEKSDMELAEQSAVGVGLVKVREADGTPSSWVKQLTFTNGTVSISGADATVTIAGVNPGDGSMTTIDFSDDGVQTQVGDSDIVTLNFGVGFDAAEAPDTEIDITLDLSPGTGNATLVAEDDALQVKYDTTDFGEGAGGLVLGASPTLATSIAIGSDPADAGAVRLDNAAVIGFEDATEATITHVDNTGFSINLALDVVGALSGGTVASDGDVDALGNLELGHASDTTIARDSAGVISVEGAVVSLLGATIGASEVDADVATQNELDTVAALVDTDDEIIAIINASPSTYVDVAAGGTGVGTLALNGVLYGNGASDIGATAIGTAGQVLVVGADPFVPVFSSTLTGITEITGMTTPLTVAQGGTGATSNTPTNITPVDTGDEAATFYPVLVDGATGDQATETDGELTYNPSTGVLTVPDLDLLGAPFPDDPGADRVLSWDDSATGAELVWGTAGAGDLLADGSVPLTAGWDVGSYGITAQDLTADTGDVTVGDDVILADGAVVGIAGNEVITFNAAGSINVTGATMDVDGAFTASTVASDGAVSGTTITGTGKLSTTVATEQFRLSYDATNYLTAVLLADGHTTFTTVDPDGAEADINFAPDGNVGIKTAAPSTALEVTGTVTATAFAGPITGNVTGTADLATTVTITDDEATADEHEVAFTTDNLNLESDGDLTYNPSTGVLTVPDMDLLGAPFPDDPGADRVLMWDDSATGAELIWTTAGVGDLLADGTVPLTAAWDVGSYGITAQDLTADTGDVTVGDDIILADGAVVGIAANEIITFNASGTIAISGADLAIGANPADAGTGIRMSNNTVIEFEDSENTGEVTALQVDASETILIGDANASGVTIVPATSVTGVLTGAGGIVTDSGLTLENGGVITFTDASATTITHVDNTGLLINLELEVDGTLDADGVVALGDGGDNFSVASDGIDIDTSGNITNAGTYSGGAITSSSLIQSSAAAPSLGTSDSDDAAGTGSLTFASANTQDVIGSIYVDVAGSATEYVQIDGVAETVDMLKPLTGTDATFSGTTTVASLSMSGVAAPQFSFQDSDAVGTASADEESAKIMSNMTTTTEDAEVSDLWFTNMQAGTTTTVMLFDGSANSIEAENIINAEVGITTSNGTTSAGFVDIYEDEDDGSNYVKLTVPAMASNYTLTLPTTGGTDGYVLKTDGSGTTSWTSAGTATAWDDIDDPDNNATKTITFDNAAEATTLSNVYDTAGSFFKIDNTDADLANNTYLLHLEYTDDGQANADFLKVSDNNGDVKLTIQEEGNIATTGTLQVDGAVTFGSATVDSGAITAIQGAQTGDPQVVLDLTADANGDFSITTDTGDIVMASAADITLTATNLLLSDGVVIRTATDSDSITLAANGEATLTQELQAGAGIDATGQTIIASAFTGTASLATTVTVSDDESTADAHEVAFTTDNTNLESDGDLNYNPSTGTLAATEFSGGGGSLTGVDAATGDSATDFFDAGEIVDARIADALTVDMATGSSVYNSAADVALGAAGEFHLNTTDEQLSFHSAADGEISGEAALSLLEHIVLTFDPAWAYDQESTYRTLPIMYVGDDFVEGITITEWKVAYVGGDPTTELDADIICDTTPDYNPAAGATVMDVIDTTAGAATADTGFDSASCANGSIMYVRFGADPTDANVLVTLDIWGYAEED